MSKMKNVENIKRNFGIIVRKFRVSQNMTQEELAEKTELHRTYISEVERGERNVSLININKISSSLNVELSQLFLLVESEEE
ncbi:helix-turn-helix transcriptional regulator [Priestia aryabhattai]|uniref:helix-turn-helix domain-containing protein n=1 Tax=Priestia aryabhattai TaxID=412384 RepID=UPI002E226FD1|nr:helix-turn-helix transcriptional regulator [Priestia aryabhattai]